MLNLNLGAYILRTLPHLGVYLSLRSSMRVSQTDSWSRSEEYPLPCGLRLADPNHA